MRRCYLPHAPVLLCLVLAGACGGGTSGAPADGPVPPPTGLVALAGSWFGFADREMFEADTIGFGSLGLEVGANGTVSSIRYDGAALSLTATITPTGPQSYLMTDSDRGLYHLWVDATGTYAALLEEGTYAAVLQKGARALDPPYTMSDIDGRMYTGPAVMLAPTLQVDRVASATVTLRAGGAFDGSVATTQFHDRLDEGAVWASWSDYGFFGTEYVDEYGDTGILRLLVAPDARWLFGIASTGRLEAPCCDDRVFLMLSRR